ncbi:MAG: class I SAM-dependent RNA methyltransferase [Clostridia bacterium]|nr:class I SAM-dependent RNA methyltransferase [Clostridia bacterium]
MTKIQFAAPCLMGLEGLCADELKRLEIENVRAENGRVLFEGDFSTLARANLCSRYSERIQILLGEFPVYSFEDLFQGVNRLPWEEFIGEKDAFPVKGHCVSSKLSSVPDCQKIIKKSVAKRLGSKYGTSWLEETGSLHQIQFLIIKDRCSIMLDTSGAGLHKRGYRANSAAAPIKETLAAAMADLSRVRHFSTVIDPFCGSGTILIESALKALNIAPGLRRGFAAEKWGAVPSSVWALERERAMNSINKEAEFQAYGYDIDPAAVELTLENARKAGVENRIHAEVRDIRDFSTEFDRAAVICNPPYGERLLDMQRARELYKIMGSRFIQKNGWSYSIISPDDSFEDTFGRPADKRRKLYNGMIKCQLYMYFRNNR